MARRRIPLQKMAACRIQTVCAHIQRDYSSIITSSSLLHQPSIFIGFTYVICERNLYGVGLLATFSFLEWFIEKGFGVVMMQGEIVSIHAVPLV
jgi:hypothetical protein